MNKEEREKVEELNFTLGSKHRTKPYDFKNPDDIIEATVMATAEYCDMAYYWSTIENILDELDESLETFYPEEWVKHSKTNNKYFNQADCHLEKASDALNELMDQAEEKCKEMWNIAIFNSSNEVMKYFFEEEMIIKKEIINFILNEKLIEVYGDIDYNGIVVDSAKMFAKVLKEKILLYERIGIDKG